MFASGRDLPPIHFGRADGVECALLREACQSEFDEIVSMASRPAKRGFARTAGVSTSFRPPRYGVGRTGMLLIAKVQAQASRPIEPIELGAALEL